LSPDNKPTLGQLFPGYQENSIIDGAYSKAKEEVWIIINENKTLTISETKPVITENAKKFIRFLTPWTNTNAIMFLNDTEYYMTAAHSPYCGWFQSRISKPTENVNVYFKQTIGTYFVGKNGLTEDKSSITPISLDSAFVLSDTVWIEAYPTGTPKVYSEYPGILGNCPIKTLPVMMFDWYDGSMNSDGSKNGLGYGEGGAGRTGFDARGVPMFGTGTNEDFGQGGCEGAPMTGMVEKQLGINGVPVMATNFPSKCKNSSHINKWFLPEVIAEKNGVSYTNVTCRELELTLTNDGYWLGQKDDESPEHGFFFLDDFRWLDDAQTIENPYYDSLNGGNTIPGYHNYGFTMKVQAEFVYVKGQYFEFNGDDDVWVFINNKLAVDIGGQHKKVKRSVNLDDLGLTPGKTYPFHIFYAERKRMQSNFMMRTSIDLNIPSNITVKDLSTNSTLIKKEIWQNAHKNALSCDFSVSAENMPKELGPSKFTLFGSNLPTAGEELSKLDNTYYNGITISNNYTLLTIDTESISQAQILSPGTYYIRSTLMSNSNDYEDVYFTISEYQASSSSSTSAKSSSSSSKNNSKSSSSSSKKASSSASSPDSKDTDNGDIDFYVKMTGAFEFEIVIDEALPSSANKYSVMDMMGQVISVGELSEKSARIKVPTAGAYVVKVNLAYKRVNVK
jgi:fibro-slime domain-containing protein